MFRKTITRLAYSPSLAEELTDYARRLKKEEMKRQIGLIFVALALIIQLFAVLFPPESANAGSTNAFFESNLSSINEYLGYYDQNTRHVRDLFSSLGIARADIQSAHKETLASDSPLYVWYLTSRGDGDDTAYGFQAHDGTTRTAYYRPMGSLSDLPSSNGRNDRRNEAFVGFSSTAGWFALLQRSGNLVTKSLDSSNCLPKDITSSDAVIPLSQSDIKLCHLELTPILSAHNLTLDTLATDQDAHASDRILYTLTVTNHTDRTLSLPLSIGLTDTLEYANLIDKGGATFRKEEKNLNWAPATIPSGASLTRDFVVQLLPVIPSTARGGNNPLSFDCVMSASFGNVLRVPVKCPFPKAVESTVAELPVTSVRTNIVVGSLIAIITTYLYLRSKQLRTELRLIRHNHYGGL